MMGNTLHKIIYFCKLNIFLALHCCLRVKLFISLFKGVLLGASCLLHKSLFRFLINAVTACFIRANNIKMLPGLFADIRQLVVCQWFVSSIRPFFCYHDHRTTFTVLMFKPNQMNASVALDRCSFAVKNCWFDARGLRRRPVFWRWSFSFWEMHSGSLAFLRHCVKKQTS